MKITPIIKFNSGVGAILCNECRIIIKEGLTPDEFKGNTNLLYCLSCERKLKLKKLNKHQK